MSLEQTYMIRSEKGCSEGGVNLRASYEGLAEIGSAVETEAINDTSSVLKHRELVS